MGLADDRKPVNLMTVHVSKSVTVHEVSNIFCLVVFEKMWQIKKVYNIPPEIAVLVTLTTMYHDVQ